MTWNLRTIGKRLAGLLVVALVGAQFVPVERDNPAVDAAQTLRAPDDVAALLKRACYDCHSHETHWPWYAYVAPASWLVAHDVEEGRDELNFSTWNAQAPERKAHKLEEMVELVEAGEMPPAVYMPLHPEAELSAADVQLLEAWAASESGG